MTLLSPIAIDLFSGAGGLSLAAHNAGINVVAAIELDKKACETYKENFINRLGFKTTLVNQDILKLDPALLMKQLGLVPNQLDLMLGGPPCQGFSSHRINDAGVDDPRNKLLLRYFDFVAVFKPKVFLVENVPGLLWKKHKDYLGKFIKLTEAHGYKIIGDNPIILNAKDYGVPQNRKRIFILAIRNDLPATINWPPVPTHHSPKSGKMSWLSASSVFEQPPKSVLDKFIDFYINSMNLSKEQAKTFVDNLPFGTTVHENDPCAIHMQHTPQLTQRFEQTPLNGSREDISFRLPCHENNYGGHKDVYGRVIFHLPSNTITTGCNNPSKGRFVHPWLNHGITLRHAARLQTFPDNFVFLGNATEQARQIGNAVPVLLGEKIIKNIIMGLFVSN